MPAIFSIILKRYRTVVLKSEANQDESVVFWFSKLLKNKCL